MRSNNVCVEALFQGVKRDRRARDESKRISESEAFDARAYSRLILARALTRENFNKPGHGRKYLHHLISNNAW